jgi:hypothetical protein
MFKRSFNDSESCGEHCKVLGIGPLNGRHRPLKLSSDRRHFLRVMPMHDLQHALQQYPVGAEIGALSLGLVHGMAFRGSVAGSTIAAGGWLSRSSPQSGGPQGLAA